MKMKYIGLFAAMTVFFCLSSFAQKTEEIKVWGNCGSCKKTIEAAAIKAGAKSANWNKDSKVLSIEFKEKKTDIQKIQQAIANAGYDTQDITAPSDAYANLAECCQYPRKGAEKK
ncbi:MAG: heavy-metal-associated domain-containing protein [Bacteroidota bacterium]|jgi:mercuric ion binding protein